MEKVLFQRIMTENINTFLTTKGESRIGNFNSATTIKDKTISEVEAEVKKENIHNIIENAFTNTHTKKYKGCNNLSSYNSQNPENFRDFHYPESWKSAIMDKIL